MIRAISSIDILINILTIIGPTEKTEQMAVKNITRTIQWYGLIRFPQLDEGERIHWWRLIADMKRRPSGEYRNDGIWQPSRGFWGNVCLRRDGRVLRHAQLEFRNQVVMEWQDTEGFLFNGISCHLDATLKSIENLAIALGAAWTTRYNPIRNWKAYALMPSDFSVKMIAENAIADFILEYDLLQTCSVDMSAPGQQPDPPPRPPNEPILPPEEDFEGDISPPYEGRDDEGQTYNPDPEPEIPDFPIGDNCQIYRIDILYWAVGEDPSGPGTPAYSFFYAPVEDIYLGRFQPGDTTDSVIVLSAGRIDVQDCEPGQRETIVAYNVARFEIVSIQQEIF